MSVRTLASIAAFGLALVLLPIALAVSGAWLFWGLSSWSAALGLCLILWVLGLLGFVLHLRGAGSLCLAGTFLLLVTLFVRVTTMRGSALAQLVLLPEATATRLINALVPEADGCLLAAGLLGLKGGLPDEEGPRFRQILSEAYTRAGPTLARLPTPAVATYLGLERPLAFDAALFSPPQRKAKAALLFLHGYAGNFNVYCWEVAQAAAQANMLTLCPSTTAQAHWWDRDGDAIFRASVRYLRGLGATRIYLAGLSNGGAGASRIGLAHARELAGLILISGVGADQAPAIPTLVIQGSRDRMMGAARARAYAKGRAHVRYREIPGGHLIFFSQYEQVRGEIARFLRSQEARR